VVGVLIVVAVLIDVFRRDALRTGAALVLRSAPALVLALVFPALAAVCPDGWLVHVAAAAAGLVAYVVLALALWPDMRHRALALAGRG
jgi:hypothetical protein